MNTFLPYSDFILSAKVLDKKRCWKQVVEAKQIIDILEKIKTENIHNIPWSNHPAIKMWIGYSTVLKCYFDEFLWECIHIHGIKTKYKPYHLSGVYDLPWWFGNEDFHRAMRARLIEKNKEFYLPLFPNDEGFNNGKYFWPDMETKTFKII